MVEMLKVMVSIVNELHDLIENFSSGFNTQLDDKQLHFIVIAIIGMLIYFVVNMAFKAMAKYSISILSFIYTFTVLLVIVFAIELEQKLTNRGQMEFADIVAGVWGFIAVFAVYIIIYNLISFIKKSIKKIHTGKHIER
ncbi:hypothetical protein K2F40_10025 [Clostridium sp. CM028]|uniref:hypothetical protein n=1 Tax=unclassified Clostridium TaxID=2614128 RepID=UPI001C0CB75E|nr:MULTISPECIES: hypothetical protein [unclassified Clostridium]MBU3091670.1 hypothetical protein [Clostridium sp. CF011]MBW9144829.1 hypothetical protein [Clostridium sp. CM027]MBW9149297.1 hypothetical protein [Clostridium sp. CM028]UVE40428.1 hypothetical protein KTC92_15065 [Clostridium sp. CM027]WAG69382.1 hypothetical protein LL036_15485 [Clostridium sp. CF011]